VAYKRHCHGGFCWHSRVNGRRAACFFTDDFLLDRVGLERLTWRCLFPSLCTEFWGEHPAIDHQWYVCAIPQFGVMALLFGASVGG